MILKKCWQVISTYSFCFSFRLYIPRYCHGVALLLAVSMANSGRPHCNIFFPRFFFPYYLH